jgi:aryl-alcohol dehydrogenase-like predicted oxidoreductase
MEYRTLGKSNLRISAIGFGCMSLQADAPDNQLMIDHAIEKGVNFFDTADLYAKGMNEVMLGQYLKGKRKDVMVATKVGNQWREDGTGWDWNPSKEYMVEAVEKSLQRLQTDYIDLYQLHGGTMEDNKEDIIDAFETLQQQGKIRHYGISSIRPNVIAYYAQHSNIVSVMMQYSLLDRRPEEQCLDLLQQHQVGVLARGSLASGLLIHKQPQDYLGHFATVVETAAKTVQELTIPHRNPTQTAIRYVLQHPAVSSAVVGIRTKQQLHEALLVPAAPDLTAEETAVLHEAVPANFYEQHRL